MRTASATVGAKSSDRGSWSAITVPGAIWYTSVDCSGSVWTRYAGANSVHNIDLSTVGIGSAIRSYEITW